MSAIHVRPTPLATQLADIESQLETTMSSFGDIVSADAADAAPLLASIERRASACRAFLDARAAGADVHLLTQIVDRESVIAAVEQARLNEAYATVGASFAMASGDSFAPAARPVSVPTSIPSAPTPIRSTWEDGREFQWVGSQCIVSR